MSGGAALVDLIPSFPRKRESMLLLQCMVADKIKMDSRLRGNDGL